MNLLVFVGDPDASAVVRKAARGRGWGVLEVGGVQGALAALRKGGIDAAVVDLGQVRPGMADSSYLIALAQEGGGRIAEAPEFVDDVVLSLAPPSDLAWRLRALERAAREKAKVAHKINNPLAAILGNLEWMRTSGEKLSREGEECLGDAFECAERIRDIVKSLAHVRENSPAGSKGPQPRKDTFDKEVV